MKFDEETNCDTCEYGYFTDFSLDGYHSLCGKYECYLCARIRGQCDSYNQGTPPEESEPLD